jgi:hypothetical protein
LRPVEIPPFKQQLASSLGWAGGRHWPVCDTPVWGLLHGGCFPELNAQPKRLEAANVVNTRPLDELRRLLQRG